MLEEKIPNKDEYRTKDFKSACTKIDNYLKALNKDKIPENEYPVLHATLLRLAAPSVEKDKKKDKKKDKNPWRNRDSNIWKYLDQKTSREFSDSVFAEINS